MASAGVAVVAVVATHQPQWSRVAGVLSYHVMYVCLEVIVSGQFTSYSAFAILGDILLFSIEDVENIISHSFL